MRVRARVISAAITGARKGAVQVSETGSEVHCCWKVAASNAKPGMRRRLGMRVWVGVWVWVGVAVWGLRAGV